jgi:hypothetical protein
MSTITRPSSLVLASDSASDMCNEHFNPIEHVIDNTTPIKAGKIKFIRALSSSKNIVVIGFKVKYTVVISKVLAVLKKINKAITNIKGMSDLSTEGVRLEAITESFLLPGLLVW